eukprot:TRINITY_DN1787_c0_g1_i1.p3 TRINITY_DN1787_c0_g1~~TRINITY_DN1787_c0_g1_i1.p3  ORF type:complete len:234 (+),score=1.45 TRINITY_DN1787_c0_g1_i1:98-799(+)
MRKYEVLHIHMFIRIYHIGNQLLKARMQFVIMIYVLLLKEGKYYVGFTRRRNGRRILDHWSEVMKEGKNKAAAWTKKYPPVMVIGFIEGDEEDESLLTLQLMKHFGIDNVRGGQWVEINLSVKPDLESNKPLVHKDGNTCYHCSLEGHWTNGACPYKGRKTDKLLCNRCLCIGHETIKCNRNTNYLGKPLRYKCPICSTNEHAITNCPISPRTFTVPNISSTQRKWSRPSTGP